MLRAMRVVACLWIAVGYAGCEKGTKIETVEPASGSVAGGDEVLIKGQGFTPAVTVHFGPKQVDMVVVESPEVIRVKTPPGTPGPTEVILTDSTGKTYALKKAFHYVRRGGAH